MHTTDRLIEYIKLHKLSLIQDMENVSTKYPKEYLQGAIACMDHILEVADEF